MIWYAFCDWDENETSHLPLRNELKKKLLSNNTTVIVACVYVCVCVCVRKTFHEHSL